MVFLTFGQKTRKILNHKTFIALKKVSRKVAGQNAALKKRRLP